MNWVHPLYNGGRSFNIMENGMVSNSMEFSWLELITESTNPGEAVTMEYTTLQRRFQTKTHVFITGTNGDIQFVILSCRCNLESETCMNCRIVCSPNAANTAKKREDGDRRHRRNSMPKNSAFTEEMMVVSPRHKVSIHLVWKVETSSSFPFRSDLSNPFRNAGRKANRCLFPIPAIPEQEKSATTALGLTVIA